MQDFSQEDTPIIPLIVMRIEAPTRDLDEFIGHYCRYFAQDVMFLPTEGFQPPGRRVRFTFALSDGREVVWGEGIVLRMRRDSGDPQRPPGMELHYSVLDEASQRIVDQMLALRLSGTAMRRPDPPPYVSMWLGPSRESPRESQVAPEAPAALAPVPLRASVPANPFWDVPTKVLHDFVDWAFERMNDRTERMRLPPIFDEKAPAERAPRDQRAWFAAGMAVVVAALLAVGLVAFRSPPDSPAPPAETVAAPQKRAAAQRDVAASRKDVAASRKDVEPRNDVAPPKNNVAAQHNSVATQHNSVATQHNDDVAMKRNNIALQQVNVATQQNSPVAGGIQAAPSSRTEPLGVQAAAVPRPAAARLVPLAIAVTPAGAWVTVDDRRRRRAPFTLDVEPGPHAITVERPRYATACLQVQAPGELEVPLVRPTAQLLIRSTAPGAEVRLDGHAVGRTPLEIATTGYEHHRIEVDHERRRLYVKPPVSVVDVKMRGGK
ncbi:MAG TPA: PEGA domain-containing protein [Polyangia bacterium]|nr:PEGA domain-containing protein [Polyangia bacterium]